MTQIAVSASSSSSAAASAASRPVAAQTFHPDIRSSSAATIYSYLSVFIAPTISVLRLSVDDVTAVTHVTAITDVTVVAAVTHVIAVTDDTAVTAVTHVTIITAVIDAVVIVGLEYTVN